uniref:CSON009646 protein n=1 Tax=Culicoides sonorensis TaxID=179676 RepID=A0A336KG09_CULSO
MSEDPLQMRQQNLNNSNTSVNSIQGAANNSNSQSPNNSNTAQILALQKGNIMTSSSNPSLIAAENLARENAFLKEKLKEISADRDRLLCEVANLRVELDMAELKQLPDQR